MCFTKHSCIQVDENSFRGRLNDSIHGRVMNMSQTISNLVI